MLTRNILINSRTASFISEVDCKTRVVGWIEEKRWELLRIRTHRAICLQIPIITCQAASGTRWWRHADDLFLTGRFRRNKNILIYLTLIGNLALVVFVKNSFKRTSPILIILCLDTTAFIYMYFGHLLNHRNVLCNIVLPIFHLHLFA